VLTVLVILLTSSLFGEQVTLGLHNLTGLVEHLQRELAVYHGRKVHVNGFLSFHDGQWILSCEPHLKSCCIPNKMGQQIVIKNFNIDSVPSSMVSMTGLFLVHPEWDSEGELKQLFVLENASIVLPGWPFSTLLCALLTLCGSVFLAFLLKKEKVCDPA